MKKLLLILLSCVSSAAMAQISVSPSAGCPNTTHDVTVHVTNNIQNVPNGTSYYLTLNVKDNDDIILKTFTSSTVSTGFPTGTTQDFVIPSVPFVGPMTCKVDGSISATTMLPGPSGPMPFTVNYPIPSQNYNVAYPLTLTIVNTDADLSVVTPLNGYSVRYYLDANYSNVINESTTGNYTAANPGSYTAKAYDPASGCLSVNASNAIVITANPTTGVQNSKNIKFSVYPNPVTSFVTVESGVSSTLTYELSGLNGKVLRSGSFQETSQINTEDLNAGTYVLIIKDGKESLASYKLVK